MLVVGIVVVEGNVVVEYIGCIFVGFVDILLGEYMVFE